jgi:hypothetical protein
MTAVMLGWVAAASGRLAADRGVDAVAPARLSDTGLYADVAALAIDPRNRSFAPQYPLWSDGAAKRRWVRLPDGATIDARDRDRWDLPVGTRFWKEFAFNGRRVETRMFWKDSATHWQFASYAWTDDQRDAVLVPASGLADVAEIAPGRWHSIPSEAECRACHDSGRTEALGFTALQLSDDRDPLAPHAEPLAPGMLTLRTLLDEGRLAHAPEDLRTTPPRVAASDPRERAVLGYLSTNCGSCHNPASTIASLGLDLRYALATTGACAPAAIATTAGHAGHWAIPTAPEGSSRLLTPGRPDLSALFVRAKSRRPSSQMPPIGTTIADREALALIEAWIAGGVPAAAACPSPVSMH